MQKGCESFCRRLIQAASSLQQQKVNRLIAKFNLDWNDWQTNQQLLDMCPDPLEQMPAGVLPNELIGPDSMEAICAAIIQKRAREQFKAACAQFATVLDPLEMKRIALECIKSTDPKPDQEEGRAEQEPEQEEEAEADDASSSSSPKIKKKRRKQSPQPLPEPEPEPEPKPAFDAAAELQTLRTFYRPPPENLEVVAAEPLEPDTPLTLDQLHAATEAPDISITAEHRMSLVRMLQRGNYVEACTRLNKTMLYIAKQLDVRAKDSASARSNSTLTQARNLFLLATKHHMYGLRHLWPDKTALALLKKHASALGKYLDDHPEERAWWQADQPQPPTIQVSIGGTKDEPATTAVHSTWLRGQ